MSNLCKTTCEIVENKAADVHGSATPTLQRMFAKLSADVHMAQMSLIERSLIVSKMTHGSQINLSPRLIVKGIQYV